ncbi:MAG: hypothetical protein MUC87_01905 [Bacteroidia bacterium]|jgi:hypothetical protein|nr:hypothetical protein [Bacteroidia bacterium]
MANHKLRKNELRKEIAALIDSIKNQSDRIGTTRHVPQPDIDLILHSIEQLHRKAVVFSYLNTLPEEEEAVLQPVETRKPEPVVIALNEQKAPAPETPPQPEIKLPEPPKAEPVPVPEVKAPEPPKAEPVPVPEVKAPEPPEAEPVPAPEVKAPEPPKAEPVPLPEVKAPEPAVATPKPAARGKDVRSMIGFNEKLMFLRNLFGGDAAAYDEALNHLNTTTSAGEAEAFVSVLQREYRWASDSEPAELFRNVVKRRFS